MAKILGINIMTTVPRWCKYSLIQAMKICVAAISEMFWSKIVKRFRLLSSEVRYGLCSLVNNNFHHEKLLKECFVMIMSLFITDVQAPSDFFGGRVGGGGGKGW